MAPAASLFLLLAVLWCGAPAAAAHSVDTCRAGKVTLRNASSVTTTTDVFGATANVTFNFCAPAVGSVCGANSGGFGAGYVEVVADGACVESFTTLLRPPAAGAAQTTTFTVANPNETSTFRVSVQCNSSGAPGEVYSAGDLRSGGTNGSVWFEADFSSVEGCQVNNFFCAASDDCVGASCINGICIDTSCPMLSSVSQVATVPANYLSLVRVTDCYGFPVQGLLAENISVRLNGDSIDDPPLSFAVDNVRRAANLGGVVRITTLMIQQNSHVVSEYEDDLKEHLRAFLVNLTEAGERGNYIALVVFDGSASPVTVQPHTTDLELLQKAVDALPLTMPDPLPTNLYGAVVYGLEASYQMQSTFNESTYTTLVLFSDGFDTAARITKAEAIRKAQYFAAKNVTTLALGISNRSDLLFLRKIATSGYFNAFSMDSLADAFGRLTRQILTLRRNVYYVLLCVPNRKNHVSVEVSLSPSEAFANVHPLQFTVDTSGFTGGCNESVLNGSIVGDNSSFAPAPASVYLPSGGSLTEALGPYASLRFYTNCTADVCLLDVAADVPKRVSPRTVLVLVTPRCVLSPFCFDDAFDDNYTVRSNASAKYQFMLISGVNRSTVFNIVSLAPPHWTVPPPFLSRNLSGVRDLAGEADLSAIVILALSTLLLLAAACACVCRHHWRHSCAAAGDPTPYRRLTPYPAPRAFQKPARRTSLNVPVLPRMEQMGEEGAYGYSARWSGRE
ncbi:von Willebrand factor type A [Trypanosoma conorhini]|uniref:von Willebrand factor type A n=1 Tax=Trypanosoma conorhini TaxID=83891 RepID=A0A3S5IUI1_9TRYP|nr:von Willebrand factor type A [Trypanosoma conorhini]RNF25974.1 von Willebrand factor type A [Trypanosoma conorhini]